MLDHAWTKQTEEERRRCYQQDLGEVSERWEDATEQNKQNNQDDSCPCQDKTHQERFKQRFPWHIARQRGTHHTQEGEFLGIITGIEAKKKLFAFSSRAS